MSRKKTHCSRVFVDGSKQRWWFCWWWWRSCPGIFDISVLLCCGCRQHTNKDAEEALLEQKSVHFPSLKPIATKQYDKSKTPTKEIKDSCLTWIIIAKVKDCLFQLKSKKAAGPDGLKLIIFKYSVSVFQAELEAICQSVLYFNEKKRRNPGQIY